MFIVKMLFALSVSTSVIISIAVIIAMINRRLGFVLSDDGQLEKVRLRPGRKINRRRRNRNICNKNKHNVGYKN